MIKKEFILERYGIKLKSITSCSENQICIHYSLYRYKENRWTLNQSEKLQKCHWGKSLRNLIELYGSEHDLLIERYIIDHISKELIDNKPILDEDIVIKTSESFVCKSCNK